MSGKAPWRSGRLSYLRFRSTAGRSNYANLGPLFCSARSSVGFKALTKPQWAHKKDISLSVLFLAKPKNRGSQHTYLHLTTGLYLIDRHLSRVLPTHCYFQSMGVVLSKVSRIVAYRSPQFDDLTGGIDNHFQFQLQH